MWVETIDGFCIDTDTLDKLEVVHQNTIHVRPSDKVITVDLNTKDMTPEEKKKLAEDFDRMLKDLGLSEDEYEIRAWKAELKEPFILFRGTKENCENIAQMFS